MKLILVAALLLVGCGKNPSFSVLQFNWETGDRAEATIIADDDSGKDKVLQVGVEIVDEEGTKTQTWIVNMDGGQGKAQFWLSSGKSKPKSIKVKWINVLHSSPASFVNK